MARKWRPRTFDDLVGQEPITRILKNAIEQNRISHAYIFSGPRGVGKTTTARILSKAMNCEEGPTASPCGKCESCVSVAEGSSVDVIEIDGASNNSVDDIRDLRERVKYAPSGGRYKVYIIDEVHMLSGSAFNALLKTLEEPPSHVIFVLATTEMKKIPATVLSRCHHMPFRRISAATIKARLKHIADAEEIKISQHALGLVAKAADGSMRDSLTILDQISSFTDEITEEHVQNLLGMTDFSMLAETSTALIKGDRNRIIGIIESLSEQGADFRTFTRELAQFFRDLLVASVVSQPGDIIELSSDEMSQVRELVSASTEDQLALMLSEIIRAEAEVRNSSLPRMALEMALIRTSFLSSLKPVKQLIEDLDRLGSSMPMTSAPASNPAQQPRQLPEPEEEEEEEEEEPEAADDDTLSGELPPVQDIPENDTDEEQAAEQPPEPDGPADISTAWRKTLESIEAPLASKLEHAATAFGIDTLTITLSGGQAVFKETINKNLKEIEKVLAGNAGRKIRISVATEHRQTVRKKDLKEKVLQEPLIREALELFEGRIVDVIQTEEKNGGENV